MKMLTKYSLANLIIMVAIFIVSALLLFRFTQVILIREIDGDLTCVEKKVQQYVKQHNALPEDHPLGEEELRFESTGNQKIMRTRRLTQIISKPENKMHNIMQLDFPLRFQNNWYKVMISKPVEGMHHLSRALITISISTILLIILISVLLNSFFLRRLWRPFYQSMNAMRDFNLVKTRMLDFPKTSTNEFSFMNKSLLFVADKAKQDYLLLKEFTENVSHEIQTPLSIVRSKLDLMIQEESLSQKQSELAKEAYASIKKLSRLNQALLILAKIENQQFTNKEKMNLKEKAEEKIEQFRELWQSNQITIASELNESFCFINPELLDILLNNLFSNASNHNIPNGFIKINLAKNKLTVSNSGSPIPLDKNKLFTRFYKPSINSNNNGLGLSIIKQIAMASGINISYDCDGNTHSFITAF